MTGYGVALRAGRVTGVVVRGVAPTACNVACRACGRVVTCRCCVADRAIAEIVEHCIVFPAGGVVARATCFPAVGVRRIMAGGAIRCLSRMLEIDPGPVHSAMA